MMTDTTIDPNDTPGAGIGAIFNVTRQNQRIGIREKSLLARDEMTLGLLAWLLVGCVLLQKLSVTLVAGTALEFILPLEYLFIAFSLYRGAMQVRPISFICTILFFVAATASTIANNAKVTSIIYLYANYIPLMFYVAISKRHYRRFLNIHQIVMAFMALIVAIDWGVQILHLQMPNMEHIIPSQLRFFNFNYIQSLQYGNRYTKPNAFFFLETSYVAQSMAAAFVIEFCIFRRVLFLGTFISALILSFGGTGFVLLFACAPLMMFYLKPKTVGLGLALIPLALVIAASFGLFGNFEHRLDEFNHTGTSGDQRFSAQIRELQKNITDSDTILKGVGAGNMERDSGIVWTPAVKVAIEYGIFSSFIFLVAIIYSAVSGGTPPPIAFPMLFAFLFLNGGLLVPYNVFYLTIMSCMVKPRPG